MYDLVSPGAHQAGGAGNPAGGGVPAPLVRRRTPCAVLVFLAAACLYAPTVSFEPAWDDAYLIRNAPGTLRQGGIAGASTFAVSAQEKSDLEIFSSFIGYSGKENLASLDGGERIIRIARFFLDAPYVAGTLEADGPETLQINLRGFDCMTFVENVLALDMLIESDDQDFDDFKQKLKLIRYRDGVLENYTSRLHYTTEWIFDNQKKGIVEMVNIGNECPDYPLKVGYMSAHPESYPALAAPGFLSIIADTEKRINRLSFKYVPKPNIGMARMKIMTGDIIAVTTDIHGLDFSHVGFAYKDGKGVIHLLHASSTRKKVTLSEESLEEYLSGVKHDTGIVVVRSVQRGRPPTKPVH